METISISKEEYLELQNYRRIVKRVEAAIHSDEWASLLSLSQDVANELWDNKHDEIWNKI